MGRTTCCLIRSPPVHWDGPIEGAHQLRVMRPELPVDIDQQGLHELMLLSLEQIDTSFNIWMSATFAVLVVTHVVGDQLKQRVLLVIALLYGLFSLLYLGRIMDSGSLAIMYANEIVSELPTIGAPIGLLRLVTFAIGTVSTLYFLLRSSREYRE